MGMSIFLAAFLNVLVRTAPCHLLAYYPYRKHLRFAPWKTVAAVTVLQMIQAVLYGMAALGGGNIYAEEYLFALVYMAFFFFFVRADRFKLLFLYLFVMDYVMIIRGFSSFLESRLFYNWDMVLYSFRSTLLQAIVLAVTLPFMMRFFTHAQEQVFNMDAPLFWRTAWMVPALTTAIVMMFTGAFTAEQARTWRFFLVRFLLLICVFVVYFILLNSLDTIRRQAALAEQAVMQERLLSVQKTQYEQLLRHMQETKAARHDLRQHMNVIRAYLKSGEEDALWEYLNAYAKTLPADIQTVFCRNFAVNAVLSYYGEEAQKFGIAFKVSMDLPKELPNEVEVCALLGNLLENAVDACREYSEASPFIRVSGMCEENRIVFTVDNTCLQEPQKQNGRFLSGKHDGYGTGIYSVCATAGRSGGTAEFSYKDGVFYASVLLLI